MLPNDLRVTGIDNEVVLEIADRITEGDLLLRSSTWHTQHLVVAPLKLHNYVGICSCGTELAAESLLQWCRQHIA